MFLVELGEDDNDEACKFRSRFVGCFPFSLHVSLAVVFVCSPMWHPPQVMVLSLHLSVSVSFFPAGVSQHGICRPHKVDETGNAQPARGPGYSARAIPVLSPSRSAQFLAGWRPQRRRGDEEHGCWLKIDGGETALQLPGAGLPVAGLPLRHACNGGTIA